MRRCCWTPGSTRITTNLEKLSVADPPKSWGDAAVLLFGSLGEDSISFQMENQGQTVSVGLVASAVEYYFTNKVFVEGKYQEAMIDLLYYKAEMPAKQALIDNFIAATLYLARDNGVNIDRKI